MNVLRARIIQLSIGVCFFALGSLDFVYAIDFEHIASFRSDIEIKDDGSFIVTEHITYVFVTDKHGIYRCIPTIHQEKSASLLKERYIDIHIMDVQVDGDTAPYTSSFNASKEQCLKIGDPELTLTGSHEYTIQYSVAGALSYLAYGGAEVYWNVTGNGWEVPLAYVEAHISSQSDILLRERACYRGVFGETSSCNLSIGENGTVIFSGSEFKAGEGLTIAQAVNRSKIPYDVRERFKGVLLYGGIGTTLLVVFGILLYRYKTAYKIDAPIIVQYEPYPGVKPMYTGFLIDRRLDPRDITASIVYLAQQGFIKIKKIDRKILFFFEVDDYEITLLRSVRDVSDAFEREILMLLFDVHASVNAVVTLSDLQKNYTNQRANMVRLQALRVALRKDLYTQGFLTRSSYVSSYVEKHRFVFLILFACLLPLLFMLFLFLTGFVGAILATGLALYFVIDGRYTHKGYEALNHVKGFKNFLSVTESDRYLFHNAPEHNAEQFMEYLPYAIAFGVEKQWAKTFEHVSIPNPGWYDGGAGAHSFQATSLSESLGGFSSAFISSSGASASSGGGSSGGGSGGGGGGSW